MFPLTLVELNSHKTELSVSGIYRLVSPSGKSYVGSAGSTRKILRRLKDHLTMLNSGVHHAFKLQKAWGKYNNVLFVEILEVVLHDNLIVREQHFIDKFKSATRGYNSNPIAGRTRLGCKLSEETKEKIRRANTGKKASEATKQKMKETALQKHKDDPELGKSRSKKLIGIPRSEEFKRKNSEKQKERFKDPEERKRCGRPKGYKHNESTIEKMRGPKSEEHKRKMSEAAKNRVKGDTLN